MCNKFQVILGDKPLSEPMMAKFTDAHMRHWSPLIYNGVANDTNSYEYRWWRIELLRPSDAYMRRYKYQYWFR